MRRLALAGLFLGLGLALAVVAWQGFDEVAKALSLAGFRLFWLGPVFVLPLVLAALAWALLFPPESRPSLPRLIAASWIGVSINWLLPVAQIGGEIAKAAWLSRRAAPPSVMVAATIVDKVMQTAGQALVALIGIGLALVLAGDSGLVTFALVFSLLMFILLVAFVYAQRRGLLQRLATAAERRFLRRTSHGGGRIGSLVGDLAGRTAEVGNAITGICAASGPLAAYLVLRLASRLAMAAEVWLALALLGHPIGILEALMIECLIQTLRSAAFAVPGAYGVQEGGLILLGALVGVPAELALAVSLAKRLRELLVGLPGLVFYQMSEGRHAMAAR